MTIAKKDIKGRNLRKGESQDKNGRYRYRYTDNLGKRKVIYSWRLVKTDRNPSSRRSSDLSLREMIREIERDTEDGILTYEANATTVYKMLYKYLDTKPQLAISTKQNYIHIIEKNIKTSSLGNMIISKVTKSDIKRFYAYLFSQRKYAATSIQLVQNLLFPAFQMAVDDCLIRRNPCKDCMKPYTGRGLYSAKTPLTRKEQSALLNFVKHDNVYCKYYAMIAFFLGTGCRMGETLGITWNDVDFENKILSVNHQILYRKTSTEKGSVKHYASSTKNGNTRIVPLQDDILRILMQYKKDTYFISKASNCEVDGYSNFVFLNSKLKLYTPNTITRTLHSIRDAYNKDKSIEDGDLLLPDFSAHTFRHTFCTRMAENGTDIKVLQEIMGHKTIAVTMQVYNHLIEDRVKEEVSRVSSALVV